MPTTLLQGSSSIGGDPSFFAKILLTPADILFLTSAAAGMVTLVGAPGANKFIAFDSLEWNFSYPGGAQYTGGSALQLVYNNAGTLTLATGGTMIAAAVVIAAASAVGRSAANVPSSTVFANVVNCPLGLSLGGASFGGSGTGLLTLSVHYRIVEVS